MVHTTTPHFTFLPGIVTALSTPTFVCPQPGVAIVHTFRKMYVTACHRHEPDASYCHWSANRHCCGDTRVPKTN